MRLLGAAGPIWKGDLFPATKRRQDGSIDSLPPVVVDDTATATAGQPVTIPVLDNDYDPEGQNLTVVDAHASNGEVVIEIDGRITYTSGADFSGADTILYTVENTQGVARQGVVLVDVAAAPEATLTATDDILHLVAGTQSVLPVLENDVDSAGSPIAVVSAVATLGVATPAPDGLGIAYQAPAATGVDATVDSVVYTVQSAAGRTAQAIATVHAWPPLATGGLGGFSATEGDGARRLPLFDRVDLEGEPVPGLFRGGRNPTATIVEGDPRVSIDGGSLVVDVASGPFAGEVTISVADELGQEISAAVPIAVNLLMILSADGAGFTIESFGDDPVTLRIPDTYPRWGGDHVLDPADPRLQDGPILVSEATAPHVADGALNPGLFWYTSDSTTGNDLVSLDLAIEWFDGGGASLGATTTAPAGWTRVDVTPAATLVNGDVVTGPAVSVAAAPSALFGTVLQSIRVPEIKATTNSETTLRAETTSPEAGNLMLLHVVCRKDPGVIGLPEGWTWLPGAPASNGGGGSFITSGVAYRVADGTEPAGVAITMTKGCDPAICVQEIQGPFPATGALDVVDTDNLGTVLTRTFSLSTAPTTQSEGFAVASVFYVSAGGANVGYSWLQPTNDFEWLYKDSHEETYEPWLGVAGKVLDQTNNAPPAAVATDLSFKNGVAQGAFLFGGVFRKAL